MCYFADGNFLEQRKWEKKSNNKKTMKIRFIHRLTQWYFSNRALPYWGILLLDCLMVLVATVWVYAFDNGTVTAVNNWRSLALVGVVYVPCYIVGFRIFHTYSGVVRYSSFVDLMRVSEAALTGLALVLCLNWLLPWDLPREVFSVPELVMMAVIAMVLMWLLRVVVKYLYDISYYSDRAQRVFIYGVKHGGISLAKSIRSEENSKYILDGFVAHDPYNIGKWMMGVKVYAPNEELAETMKRRRANILLVSPLFSEAFRRQNELVDQLMSAGIRIHMMPPSVEWDGKSDLNYAALKEVDIEDLLPRDKIEIDMDKVGGLLKGKKILITGAAGSIGSEMVRQIAVYSPAELILIDQAETPLHDMRLELAKRWPEVEAHTLMASISNPTRMEDIFKRHRPDYVFHAAAYKHVPMMEDNPSESIQNNVYGTRVVADLAVKYGTKKFVMVSTDKAVNPTNVMGCSKRICEIYVQSLDKAIKEGKVKGETRFVTTRFGNVLGSNGSVIPLFKEQIRNGGPITVTHPDIIRYFMLIPEACKLVLEAGTMGQGGEIYVFDMGQPVKIVDLAKRMISLSGAQGIDIKFTGLRDGEKLYEEVLNDAEFTKPTYNPKIKIAAVREYDYDEVLRNEQRLHEASFGYDDMEIVRIMKEIVPEFKSQHSKYEELDAQ